MHTQANALPALELWGGVECTVNRVGDRYFDQLERSGHACRVEDLDLFASLGIRGIRYPLLWERIAPHGLETANWEWADQRLQRLRDLGIRPIVGLVHHGSGPVHTNLNDPSFPHQLAQYAQAVAERYPWIDAYTPINEPLTTARFSGLYGHWYPHGQDDRTFLQVLLHQCQAITLAMQAIRQINPQAQLVQTEDLGKTYSTPLLADQAEFENERRWLSFDLLFGGVNPQHSLWKYFIKSGIDPIQLEPFQSQPCPPNILGINHYLTSERWLDEHLDHYPEHFHGGNGQHTYADVEAVRVCAEGLAGHGQLLREVWERYGQSGENGPAIAVTEVHLGCTREEQLRWLDQVWQSAQDLRSQGVKLVAITAWSLLGAYDWNSLVTRDAGFYEPGVFDLRSPTPRATALAWMLRYLSEGRRYDHPLLLVPGWWQRPERLHYRTVNCFQTPGGQQAIVPTPPVLITGATGTLGRAFARICQLRGIPYRLLGRREMDITNPVSVHQVLEELQPWAVINTAGYVRVDDAEREAHLCRQINTDGAAILAQACVDRNTAYVTFSSDLVFDGQQADPYVESCAVAPLNVYGNSKAIAEQWVLQTHPCALVIRTSAFFGPWDEYNFVTLLRRHLAAGQPFRAADDAIVSPTYVPDLVHIALDLLIDGEAGLWHLANPGAVSWAELALRVAEQARLDATLIQPLPTRALGLLAQRPAYSVLGSERGNLLPCLHQGIDRYLTECEIICH